MKADERLECIKIINPDAHCVVWEGGKVIYDNAHVGKKPTLIECESVLTQARENIELRRSQGNEIWDELNDVTTIKEIKDWLINNLKEIIS